MSSDHCEFCFSQIGLQDGEIIRCVSCGSLYHAEHYEQACLCCSATTTEAYAPRPSSSSRQLTRKPVKLKRNRSAINDPQWDIRTTLSWVSSQLRAILMIAFGISLATLIGSFTYRLVNFPSLSNPLDYLNNIIRNQWPSRDVLLVAFVTSILGAVVFFPSKLRTLGVAHSSKRRVNRLVAIFIILFLGNIVFFRISATELIEIASSGKLLSVENTAYEIMAAQVGAIIVTIVLGPFIRAKNEHAFEWEHPAIVRAIFDIFSTVRFYVIVLAAVALAGLVTTRICPDFSTNNVTIELFENSLRTSYTQLAAMTTTVFFASLLYHPPAHSAAERKWWPIRTVICGLALVYFINIYRLTSASQLGTVLLAVAGATGVTILLVPVQRGLS
ncbi:MAG: hypothetical protein M9928_11075 [Anaerolineae bacterium]|nr:hypothetical protein [Anaerolineae bacterium]MCO5205567.1 hypothetical protein [Anaerolineae bacterium]